MSPAAAEVATPAWERLRAELVRFVAGRVRDPAAADDIVHDVLVRSLSQLAGPAPPVQLRAWLYRVTRNAIVDHYRARRPEEELHGDRELQPAETGGADDPSAEQELAGCLAPLLSTLADPYRRALTLAEVDGVPQVEIARREGLSLPGAKSRVQRARRMLRAAILDCCRVEVDRRGGILYFESRPDGSCSHLTEQPSGAAGETSGASGCRTCKPRA